MRQFAAAIAVAAALAASTAAALANDDGGVWLAAQRAQAAEEALSARYTAIWQTLDRAQKTAFSARERAWLNGGRQAEQQACVAHAGTASDFVVRSCDAVVVERHLTALAAPQRIAATR